MLKRNKYIFKPILHFFIYTRCAWDRPRNQICTVHVLITRYDPKPMCMCCSRAMTSIPCACAVHVLFMRYDVIVGIPLRAIWGGGGNLLVFYFLLFTSCLPKRKLALKTSNALKDWNNVAVEMIIKTVYVALIALVRLVFFTAPVVQANVVILMISVNQETAMSLKV